MKRPLVDNFKGIAALHNHDDVTSDLVLQALMLGARLTISAIEGQGPYSIADGFRSVKLQLEGGEYEAPAPIAPVAPVEDEVTL